uniref:Uncharacterized protein n=1 Tax=Musca domestica TaxID=7370 RepID=A0A1I8MWC1_MUSDO
MRFGAMFTTRMLSLVAAVDDVYWLSALNGWLSLQSKRPMFRCTPVHVFGYAEQVKGEKGNIIEIQSINFSIKTKMNDDDKDCKSCTVGHFRMSKITFKRIVDIRYFFDAYFRFTKLYQKSREALYILRTFTLDVILKRRSEISKLPFQDGKPLTNEDIHEEVNSLMFGGHDSSSLALLFLHYNLAKNPECQQKCYEEIMEVIGDKGDNISYETLSSLHYVDKCIKETLRIFPVVPLMARQCNEELHINGKIIPSGCTIVIPTLVMGRQSDVFPEPLKFIPERFNTDENATKLHPYASIPFAAGPRNCLGYKYAMLEMKTVLIKSLLNFEFESVVLLALTGLVVYFVKFKHMIDVTRNIPSPPSLPVLGHSLQFNRLQPHEHADFYLNLVKTYGKTLKFWLGPKLFIVLTEPSDVEVALNDMRLIEKGEAYSVMEPWFKEGLMNSPGHKWHKRRKLLTQAFHFRILKEFVKIFEQQSDIFVENLRKEYQRQSEDGFDLHNLLDWLSLDILCESAMGISINAQINGGCDYLNAVKV